jgi:hypothetical protein
MSACLGNLQLSKSVPGVIAHGAISVAVERSPEDVGLIAAGDRDFVWWRSSEAWADVVQKLTAMQRAGACHQYLDGPADDLQVIRDQPRR